MNVGIIGVGRWGKNLVREFDKIAHVVAAASGGDKENIAWLAEAYPHIRHTTDTNELLNDLTIDAVIIATPPDTHGDLACQALRAGKHIFIEKPLSTDSESAIAIETLAQQKDRVVFVGHILNYHPVFEKITALVHPSDIRHINVAWSKWGAFSGDIVWDLLPHDIGLAYALFGKPSKIEITEHEAFVSHGDILSLKLIFAERRSYHIMINRISPSKQRSVTILTDTAALVWDNDTKLYQYDMKRKQLILIFESTEQPLAKECKAFVDAIEYKIPVPTSAAFGKATVEILETIRSSTAPLDK